MRVAVLCEFSGIVRDAFLEQDHDAISCDSEPTEKPGPHIQGDLRNYDWSSYDLILAFPPCTFLTVTANRWMNHPNYPNRKEDQEKAVAFVKYIWDLPVEKICIENPVGVLSTQFMKPNQYIQPYWFGDPAQKKTCLWLKNLPALKPTKIIKPKIIRRENYSCPEGMSKTGGSKHYIDHKWHYGTDRKTRSRTFPGVAKAMAKQWGNHASA